MNRSSTGLPRRGARLLAGVLAAGTVVVGASTGALAAGPGSAGGAGACAGSGPLPRTCAQPGDLIEVTLGELHPTQAVLGFDQVFYKLGRYGSGRDEVAGGVNKRFDDWCETNGQGEAASVRPGARLDDPASFSCTVPLGQETPKSIAPMKTAVIGPGGKLYLTDGHHTLTSFLEGPDGSTRLPIRLRVTDNFSSLSTAAFWQRMTVGKKVWLRDENNKPLAVDQLPDRLGITHFRDDPYRSLVYFTRGIGYEVPDGATEFLEFSWGSWLRGQHDTAAYDLTSPGPYLDLVKSASKSMAALAPDAVVDDGKTAAQLGRIAEWNGGKKETGGEFAKLSKPLTDAKPGKLAEALDYKSRVLPAPACTTKITGVRNGPLTVTSGVTCADRAALRGPVTVRADAALVLTGSTLEGPLQSDRAAAIHVCGSSVTGPLAISRTTGPVRLGGPGCTANSLTGAVVLTGNTGGVLLAANKVTGPVACSGNLPAPDTTGRTNEGHGPRTGQCAGV
ncbi:chromosome partitioning protein ParB [Streptomyces sp. CB00316]|uniref:ParB/Srx family N-terminal domain-containing protein n=1 Tax=unclassified Streptomyces TaxID=2593676 RepID=UPI00093CA4C4|nr:MULTISPECIES: ParB/Srx family N-terminal domain-containing protein [unclassified Streptomyces]MBT2378060.1 ParB/Srx family N-terminal domain-containing protein [Streptomyces sp. ISL-111]MBT2425039.1 ParB/Srx family N-terminal domain-containing protein [Streptomyces sp. ISL-112]MBT2460308.1 ParB/Srx family N-terminal domain-containing protein [Streptomyces sp. ISL-63]OKJ22598.1 chromosome partitioning protein ParB [Streptomyces sp. CB00316]